MSDDSKRRGRTTITAALLFVAALLLAVPLSAHALICGDSLPDVGEDCDLGFANGAPDSCCASDCTFQPAATPCRDATGECDPADVCSGTSDTCDDVKRTDECRAAAGVCDVAESCDGVASDCPADVKSSAECRAAAGVCDTAETCDGVGDDCPANDFEPNTVECRASAGVCDLAEQCTGSSAACPADAKSTVECRASAGVCDAVESCDGVANACPADAFAASTTECRASGGVCDVAEHCTGSSAACPADGFAASTTECRASGGVCDVAEHCTGSGAACPADGFVAAATECRAAAGQCDAAEQCTGSSAACPADAFQPDDTPCDDANICSANDRCLAGACGGFLENCGNGTIENSCFEQCDDGNFDPGDGCDASCQFEPCRAEPLVGCRPPNVAGKAAVQIINRLNPETNRLQWKYAPGATTPKADFGTPLTTTSYQFCIWEEIGGDPRLSASYTIPAGGTCGSKPCWKESSSGFKFSDKAHTSTGIAGLQLKQGLAPGKSKIILSGKGANLPVPVMPLIQSPNVVMQLIAANGVCWETRYGMPAFRNQPDQFRDK